MAEREGFEPSVLSYTRFPGVHLQPLGHLSARIGHSARSCIARMVRHPVIDSLSKLRREISQSKIRLGWKKLAVNRSRLVTAPCFEEFLQQVCRFFLADTARYLQLMVEKTVTPDGVK